MKALENYLSRPSRDHAFLLYGPWGAGKTHSWLKFAGTVRDKQIISISAAGLESREDLDQALFQESLSIEAGSPEGVLKEAGTVLGRAALRWVKIEPKDIHFRADLTPGKTVVCIDDVERFQGDFSILFGFVISLLDADHVHVVLIADDERARTESKPYAKYRERIVSSAAQVLPNIAAFVDEELSSYTNQAARELLASHSKQISDGLEEWGLLNLRTVRATLEELYSIVAAANPAAGTPLSVRPLLSALAFWKKATATDAATTPLVARAFKSEHLGFILAAHNKQDQGEENTVASTVREAGFEGDAVYWATSQQLANLVHGMDADRAEIASDFELLVSNDSPEPHYILKRYWSYDMDAVSSAADTLTTDLASGSLKRTDSIYAAYRALHGAAIARIVDISEDDVIDLTLSCIANCAPHDMRSVDIDDFLQMEEIISHEVVHALRDLNARIEAEEAVASSKDIVDRFLTRGELSPDDMLRPVLSWIDPQHFLTAALGLGPATLHQLSAAIGGKMRINNGAGMLAEEVGFTARAPSLLREHIPASGRLTLHQAQLLVIAKQLERFGAIAAQRT